MEISHIHSLISQSEKNKRRIIFIGGAKGVGKLALAKRIQNSTNAIIINKNESTLALREKLMCDYNKHHDNTSSHEYQYIVEPLECSVIENMIKHISEYNSCSIIVVGQFFNQFSEKEWVNSINNFCKTSGYESKYIFIKKPTEKINFSTLSRKKLESRTNLRLRDKIDHQISLIEKCPRINNYTTKELFNISA